MSNKTLKIKRVFAWTIFNSLRNTPPKDFPTTGEIKSTINEVLPALKSQVTYYIEAMEKAVGLAEKVASKEVTEEESKAAVDKLNDEWRVYNKEHGSELIEISLDDEGFKTLKAQFDRENWGKKWVANLEEFGELLQAFEAGK